MAERLLVVAPHPDDESLGAGGLMAKARERGDDVFVVLVTSGDGFVEDAARYYLSLDVKPEEYLHMGYERQMETRRAMDALGVSSDHVYFLGFPDGGLDALWRTHWDGEPWISATTGFDHVPYLTAWKPDVPYLGQNLLKLLVDLYAEIRPDRIALPSAFDTHPDHWGTNAFATMAWAESAQRDPRWTRVGRHGYLVHWPTWPLPLAYRPETAAEAPGRLQKLGQEPWRTENIARPQVEQKRQALMAHASQAELIKPFMLAFCRRTEMFAEEHLWKGQHDGSQLQVSNPRMGWMSKTLGRANPLLQANWRRTAHEDGVEVRLQPGTPAESQIEVSLTVVGTPPRHFRWLTGEQPHEVSLRRERDRVLMSWPREWISRDGPVMAGLQLFHRGKCEGKIPFRLIGSIAAWP